MYMVLTFENWGVGALYIKGGVAGPAATGTAFLAVEDESVCPLYVKCPVYVVEEEEEAFLAVEDESLCPLYVSVPYMSWRRRQRHTF